MHVLTAVGWFGTELVLAFCAVVAATTDDQTTATALLWATSLVVWLCVALGATSLVVGVVLSVRTPWGLFQHWWIVAKLAITIVVVVTDLAIVVPMSYDARLEGTASNPVEPLIGHVVVLTAATVLSYVKPGGRTPWGNRQLRRRTGARPPGTRPAGPASGAAAASAGG